jgi:hypothetical protein
MTTLHESPAVAEAALRDRLRLDGIPPALHAQACEALKAGDALGVVLSVGDNCRVMQFVWDNQVVLREAGLYEQVLLEAFVGTRTNHSDWPLDVLTFLFAGCDRDKLRAAGDPLPGPGPFVLYRGIAGHGPRRRRRGLSWTEDAERAQWFATRFSLAHPMVLRVIVDETAVLAYVNDRQEREFVVVLPSTVQPVRVWPRAREMSRV